MNKLPALGQRLHSARKNVFPRDDMRAFSIRVGVSRATLQKMENGDLSVSLKYYYEAAKVMRIEDCFENLFIIKKSLFDD